MINISPKMIPFITFLMFSLTLSFLVILGESRYSILLVSIPIIISLVQKIPLKNKIYISTVLFFFPVYFQVFGSDAFNTGTLIALGIFGSLCLEKIINRADKFIDNGVFYVVIIILLSGIFSTISLYGTSNFGSSFRALLILVASVGLFVIINNLKFNCYSERDNYLKALLELIILMVIIQIFIGILIYLIPELGKHLTIFATRNIEEIGFEIIEENQISRLRSIMLDPEITSEICSTLFPFILYMLLINKKNRYIIYLIIFILGILLSVTRSGIILSCLSFTLFLFIFEISLSLKLKCIISIVILIFVFAIFSPGLISPMITRFNESLDALNMNQSIASVINRDVAYQTGFDYILSTLSPFGNGLVHAYKLGVMRLHFHNLYFTLIFELGIIGALAYLVFFYKIISKLYIYSFNIQTKSTYFQKALFLSFLVFLINEFKFEFNRTSPYHEIMWIIFSIYYVSTKCIDSQEIIYRSEGD